MLVNKDMDYPEKVIDFAIDNKVSLEEAYEIFILAGEEFVKEEEVNMDEHLTPNEKKVAKEFSLQDEKRFLRELEKKIKKEQEISNDNEISKEDLEWVEFQLKQAEELSDEEL